MPKAMKTIKFLKNFTWRQSAYYGPIVFTSTMMPPQTLTTSHLIFEFEQHKQYSADLNDNAYFWIKHPKLNNDQLRIPRSEIPQESYEII